MDKNIIISGIEEYWPGAYDTDDGLGYKLLKGD